MRQCEFKYGSTQGKENSEKWWSYYTQGSKYVDATQVHQEGDSDFEDHVSNQATSQYKVHQGMKF